MLLSKIVNFAHREIRLHFQPTGLLLARSFLAMILAFSTVVLRAQSISASQDNSGTTDFELAAGSATAAREAGRIDQAIGDYQRALTIRPQWDEGWWYLGTLLYDQDQYSQAIPAFQRLVELVPNAGPAWNFLGLCEFETKDYANSLQHLDKGLALGGADDTETGPVSKYHLALLLIRNGQFDQAVTLLASTFGQKETAQQIKISLGLAMLRAPLLPAEVDPSQDATVQAAGEVAALIAQNNRPQALSAFPSLLRDHPDTPYLHYAYGKTLASEGRDEDALQQEREETTISKDSALPWIEISQIELRLQHPQQALQAAQEAVHRAPDSSAPHKALAEALQATGRNEQAGEELAVAQKLALEKPRTEDRLVLRYSSHAEGKPNKNTQIAGSALGLQSSSFEETSARAAKAQAAGNIDEAVSDYERALQLRPEWDDGRWSLALLHYSARQYPEAISELKRWAERHQNFGAAWAVMGLCEFEIKDYESALIHLQRAEQLGFGGSPEAQGLARYHLAILENRKSQFESAMETLLPGVRSGMIASEVQFALGMALLRMPLLPDQVEPSRISLVQSAGEIAALLENSKYDQAFPKLEALLQAYPSTPFLHYAYGTALAALTEFDEAEVQLRKESEISPASELPYVALASVELKRFQPSEALASALRAVQLAPSSAEAHYVLGRACLELGEDGKAVLELEQASKLAPGSPEVHFSLARAYAKAKLPAQAEQERATFARLNSLAEERRTHSGSQAYSGSHDAVALEPQRKD